MTQYADADIASHAPHEGERRRCCAGAAWTVAHFNPRSPRGGATIAGGLADLTRELFQSTLPTRGSDFDRLIAMHTHSRISIHAPHEGERPSPVDAYCSIDIFQSTLPTRGSD